MSPRESIPSKPELGEDRVRPCKDFGFHSVSDVISIGVVLSHSPFEKNSLDPVSGDDANW